MQTGMFGHQSVDKYENIYEIDLVITPDIAMRLSWDGDPSTEMIYLYRDGRCRADIPEHLHAYLNRLALLAQVRQMRDCQ